MHIVTIHKSKGLEYPVVFCPFAFDGFQPRGNDATGTCSYHDDQGDTVIDFRDPDEQGKAEAADIKWRIKLEALAESVRLHYVALTRASHRCYVVAGCYGTSNKGKLHPTQSTRSLLNWLVAGDGIEPKAWCAAKTPPEDIEARWRGLAQRETSVGLALLPDAPGQPLAEQAIALEDLRVPAPPPIPPAWRIGSYSALAFDVASEAAAVDHDARVARHASRASMPADLDPEDILGFPRGPAAGDCLHAVLERIDFTDESTWTPAIDRALAAFPSGGGAAGLKRRRAMIGNMLRDVLATTLPGGMRLADVPRASRLSELGFHLPSPALAASALNALLHRHGYAVPQLAFRDLHGYLTGFIDLVLKHDGRYYIVDWKSNHLGYAPADYAPPAITEAMVEHGYHLQHLLYALALHRYLSRRLAGYAFERHFGGVLYLFVRGVRPSWKSEGGAATGVYFDRVRADTLAALEALFPHATTVAA